MIDAEFAVFTNIPCTCFLVAVHWKLDKKQAQESQTGNWDKKKTAFYIPITFPICIWATSLSMCLIRLCALIPIISSYFPFNYNNWFILGNFLYMFVKRVYARRKVENILHTRINENDGNVAKFYVSWSQGFLYKWILLLSSFLQ